MKPLLALFALGVSGVWAQSQSGLHARELFYTPPPEAVPAPAQPPETKPAPPKVADKKAAPKRTPVRPAAPPVVATAPAPTPAPVPLGLRYSVLKRDSAGKFQEVDPDSTFRSGDRIRIQVAVNTPGYLYVVMQGSSGNWRLLFPSSEVAGGNNLIQRGESRVVPSGDRGQFFFDEQAGVEKLFVVLARQPEQDLDKLIYSVGAPQKSAEPERTLMAQSTVANDVVQRLREQMSSRDLVFEKVDDDSGVKAEKAAYVVNPSPAADARLVVDIALKHQ